jgi:hypothetical protein
MGTKMTLTARAELTNVVRRRYCASTGAEKRKILDEFIAVTGYHHKSAIRALNAEPIAPLHRTTADEANGLERADARPGVQADHDRRCERAPASVSGHGPWSRRCSGSVWCRPSAVRMSPTTRTLSRSSAL